MARVWTSSLPQRPIWEGLKWLNLQCCFILLLLIYLQPSTGLCTSKTAFIQYPQSGLQLISGPPSPHYILTAAAFHQPNESECVVDIGKHLENIQKAVNNNSNAVIRLHLVCPQVPTGKLVLNESIIEKFEGAFLNNVVFLQIGNCEIDFRNLVHFKKVFNFSVFIAVKSIFTNMEHVSEFFSDLLSVTVDHVTDFSPFLTPTCCSSVAEFQAEGMGWTVLPQNMSAAFSSLQSLELPDNSLKEIPNFPWNLSAHSLLPSGYERDENFNLDYSLRLDLAPSEFRRVLDLSRNKITEVSKQIRGNIAILILKDNFIQNIDSDALVSVSNLKFIDLGYNNLSHVPVRLFRRQSKLERISLRHNRLQVLPTGLLDGLESLKELDLQYNRLQTLHIGSLCCGNLLRLSLTGNFLSSLPENVFKIYPQRIQYIELGRNVFNSTPPFAYYARNLKSLNLTNNRISLYPLEAALTDLDFNRMINQHLTSWASNNPPKHPGGIQLLLDNNNITRLGCLNPQQCGPTLLKLRLLFAVFSLSVRQNPLSCDCRFPAIFQEWQNSEKYLTGPGHSFDLQAVFDVHRRQYLGWTCHAPEMTAGRQVGHLAQDQFYCDVTTSPRCPSYCNCWQNPLGNVMVDCSNSSITYVPKRVPKGTTILNLNFNHIPVCHGRPYFRNLSSLYLKYSKVRRIAPSCFSFLKNPEIVELTGNSLQLLPRSVGNLNVNSLLLDENHLKCDCTNEWMRGWLRGMMARVPKSFALTCITGDGDIKPIVFTDDDDFTCPQKEHREFVTRAVAISLAVVIVIIVVVVALCRVYNMELKVFMYWRFNWHPFDRVAEEGEGEPPEYDVFVSYSSADYRWVCGTLVPRLEAGPPHYKVCFHDRDFLGGVPIDENIAAAVSKSRRMVLVLSRGFLASEWCHLEFRLAHERVLKTRRRYLVVVMLEQLDTSEIDKHLAAYLRTNTYIEVQQRWFWRKLCYSLPQQPLPSTPSHTTHSWPSPDTDTPINDASMATPTCQSSDSDTLPQANISRPISNGYSPSVTNGPTCTIRQCSTKAVTSCENPCLSGDSAYNSTQVPVLSDRCKPSSCGESGKAVCLSKSNSPGPMNCRTPEIAQEKCTRSNIVSKARPNAHYSLNNTAGCATEAFHSPVTNIRWSSLPKENVSLCVNEKTAFDSPNVVSPSVHVRTGKFPLSGKSFKSLFTSAESLSTKSAYCSAGVPVLSVTREPSNYGESGKATCLCKSTFSSHTPENPVPVFKPIMCEQHCGNCSWNDEDKSSKIATLESKACGKDNTVGGLLPLTFPHKYASEKESSKICFSCESGSAHCVDSTNVLNDFPIDTTHL